MKKIISLVLSVCMVLALVPTISFAAVEDEAEAVTADNAAVQEVMEEGDAADLTDMEAAEGTGWTKDETGWKYLDEAGTALTGKQIIGGAWYVFNIMGYLQVGWITDTDGSKYYGDMTGTEPGAVGSTYGVLKTGWFKDTDGSKYYFDPTTCKMHTGWLTVGSNKYFLNKTSGKMKTGWLKLNGSKYYFKDSGVMVNGRKNINGNTYFFNATNGKMQTGWISYNGYKFYCKDSGKMKTGWLKLNGKKYYMNPNNGRMITGLKNINGSKYYFSDSGVMKTGAKKINGALYYFYSSGKAVSSKGWFKGSDGKTRYSLGGGKVATGTKQIGSNWYEFSTKTGVCLKNLGDTYDRQIKNKSSNTNYLIQVIKSKYQTRIYRGSKGKWTKIYTFACAIGKPGYDTVSGTFTVNGRKKINHYKDNGNEVHWDCGVNYGTDGGFNSPVYWDKDGSLYDGKLGGKYSRGRVRVSYNNSLWMFNNIPNGTTVYVH